MLTSRTVRKWDSGFCGGVGVRDEWGGEWGRGGEGIVGEREVGGDGSEMRGAGDT